MNLDYSSLSLPVTHQDLEEYISRQPKKSPYYTLGVWIIGTICVLTALMLLALSFMSSGFIGGSIVTILTAIFIALTLYTLNLNRKKLARLRRFAKLNNMELILNQSNPGYEGMIFDMGSSRTLDSALLLPDGTHIGNYSYFVGSGKNRRRVRWKVVRIKLPRRLPHMILDAKANNFLSRFSNLPASFRGQTLSLEGDFDKHFTLYAPKEYGRDALYIFTPDVMASVIDAGRNYDMEIIDDNLFLYADGSISLDSEAELRPLLSAVETIATKLRGQTDYYADERVVSRSLNAIAEPGRRLKSPLTLATVIAIIIFIAYVMLFVISAL